MASIRDQISGLTIASLEPTQLSAVAGKVFLSANAVNDQLVADALTTTWRAVHVPTFGQLIPSTASSASGSGDGAMVSPSVNETAHIQAIELVNPDPVNPLTNVSVNISDGTHAPCIFFGDIQPNSAVCLIGYQGMSPFEIVYGQELTIGNATGANWTVAYALKSQG